MNYYTHLARLATETFVRTKKTITPPPDCPSSFLSQRSGVFVTIEKNHQLRGCIGTYLPTKDNIAQEIIFSAIKAAVSDPRFSPVQVKELPQLSYEVSLLNPPQPVKDIKELNTKEYGIIVQDASGRTGLLLPDLEEVDTALQQIAIACQKAGIDSLTQDISLSKFKVRKYSEEDDQTEENSTKTKENKKD